MENVAIINGYLEYLTSIGILNGPLVYFVIIWCIFLIIEDLNTKV
jgi:hypothetical protein